MNDAERKQLLDEYDRTKSPRLREQIIIEYAQLVKLVAGRLSMYLGYNVEYDDLVSYGIFGLIDAIDKFDYQGDVKFETYASLRIRGAILDHVRKLDWIPRTIRQRQKKVNMVVKALEQAKGRTPTDDEVAQAMGISLEAANQAGGEFQIVFGHRLDETERLVFVSFVFPCFTDVLAEFVVTRAHEIIRLVQIRFGDFHVFV